MKYLYLTPIGYENWKGIGKTKQTLKTPVTSLTDVTDGEGYRRECIPGGFFDPNGHNLSLLGNTDGVPLFKRYILFQLHYSFCNKLSSPNNS